MIRSFKHKGLQTFFEKGRQTGLNPKLLGKFRRVLARLEAARELKDLDYLATQGLHPLKGKLKGHYSVWITGNWRIVFRFKDGDVFDVDLLDYH